MLRSLVWAITVMAWGGFASQAQAEIIWYTASLSGPNESPPVNSPAVGAGFLVLDTTAHTMRVIASFGGLIGTTTVAHIHSPTTVPLTGLAGVASQTPSFIGFPNGVTQGVYDRTFDLTLTSSYNGAFVTANGGTAAGAEAALLSQIAQGRSYLNIHTNAFPSGEIRGFFTRATPEPSTLLVFGVALPALVFVRRRRNRAVQA